MARGGGMAARQIPVRTLTKRIVPVTARLCHNPSMFHNFRRLGTVIAPGLLFLHLASASDLPRLSFNQLTDDSELIVSGQVTRTWADWDAEHKYIWTHYELAVTATHKGSAVRTLDIAEPGGQLDGVGMSISGATGYGVGDEVLVFLSRMPNGYLRTAGFGQGKYRVDSNGRLHGTASLITNDTLTAGKGTVATSVIRSLDGMSVSQVGQLVAARVRARGGYAQ